MTQALAVFIIDGVDEEKTWVLCPSCGFDKSAVPGDGCKSAQHRAHHAPRRLRLLGDVVVVMKDVDPERVGLIFIPPSARESLREKWHRARVVAVGPGRWVHCPKCVLGWEIEVHRWDGPTHIAHCPTLERGGLVSAVARSQKQDAVDILRSRVAETVEREAPHDTLPPLNCDRCIGDRPGWVRFRRQPVAIGDVVWVQESVGGKKIAGPRAEEFFANKEVIVVPSKACALTEVAAEIAAE